MFVCCSIWMVSESELLMWTETHHSGFLNFSLPWRWCCDVGKLPSKTVVESANKCDVGESWELEGGATNRCLTSVVGLRWPSKPSWKPEVQIGWDCNRTTLAIRRKSSEQLLLSSDFVMLSPTLHWLCKVNFKWKLNLNIVCCFCWIKPRMLWTL